MMIRGFINLLLSLLLISCTESSKLRKQALDDAHDQYMSALKAEVLIPFDTKLDLRKRYLHTMDLKTEFEVQDLKIDDSEATVVVKVLTIPKVVKDEVIGLIAGYHGGNEISLNVDEVMQLISKQLKISLETKESSLLTLRYVKEGDWKLRGR